ncbi:MAG: N-acetylglucosamine-6-sulfatase [Acidobacteria bacterium]|nr:MAG: N-acetylglucosamine-6-sulfatase [Acidobacteriota bacterium]
MTQRSRTIALSLMLAAPAAAGGGGSAGRGPETAADGSRPNIVVVMTDDLDSVSFHAALEAGLLPHIRRLFARGTEFRQSFVSESLCCPSRSTYLTGLYPHNHGVVRNSGTRGGFAGFMRAFGDNNLALWLQAAGYRTGQVGKYLNGYVDGTLVPRGWDDWQALVGPSTYCMYDYDLSDNGHVVHHGHRPVKDYQTDVLAALAERFVLAGRAGADSRPFFLNVAPLAPHGERFCGVEGVRAAPRHRGTPPLPLPEPPSFNEADMSDKPAWMQALPLLDETAIATLYNQRIASLRAVGDLVGRVGGALRAIGELPRTAFVFTSDNGFLLGRHRWEAKTLGYEESIRVPLLLRVPRVHRPMAVDDEIVLNNDLAPTIAALAGSAPRLVMDGRSLLPLLEGTARSWRKRFLAAYPPRAEERAADDPDLADGLSVVPPFFAVRTGADGDLSDLVYSETTNLTGMVVARELYDLHREVDPFQVASRHDDPAYLSRRRRLEQQLELLKTCGNGTCRTREE